MSKENINLPKTAFSMKANLPVKEPELVDYWDKIKLYEKLRDISKGKETDLYEITLAVAGFKKADIDIEIEDGVLKISGTSAVLDSEDTEYLHKGIAERNFVRTFKLAEFVEVAEAKLEDGILRVSLFRNVPDAMKPQKIKIS